MRRRLLTAMLALVAGTVLLAGLGTVLLVHRAANASAEKQVRGAAVAIVEDFPALFPRLERYPNLARSRTVFKIMKAAGRFDALVTVGITPDGQIVGTLPPPLTAAEVPTHTLLADGVSSGVRDQEAYALVPLVLTPTQLGRLEPPLLPGDTAVLVATEPVAGVPGGIGWLLLVAAGGLAVAALVAYLLARRFAHPLSEAAATTERIAGGDLEAAMAVRPPPEMAALATSINTMTARLREARDQERRFLLSVSHDLRTPLTSIRGYAEAIADGALPAPAAGAAVIAEEAGRLERLVQDLLDLARLGAHRFGLQMAPLDAGLIAQSVAGRFAPQAEAAALELDCRVAGTLPVSADGDRLKQVLDNLLENAFAVARTRITLGAEPVAGFALLWVADDGPGIDPADLAQVFQPYYSRSTARRNGTGTGLGLAIVSELATAMGGGVRAESPLEEGRGTRLTVWLPLNQPGPAAAPGPPPTLPSPLP